MPVSVAVAQMCSGVTVRQNLEVIAQRAKEAAARGAVYLLTPEMSVAFSENRAQLSRLAEPYEGNAALAQCSEIAKSNGIYLHIGSLAIALSDAKFANRSVLFDPSGDVVDFYDKIHMFDADIVGDEAYRESDNYRAGAKMVVAPMGEIKLGMSICFDLRFAALYGRLARAGAQIITVPSAFTATTGKAHWHVLLRARAIETGCFVIAAAQGGSHENGRQTFGHSMIVDPWGRIVDEIEGQAPGLIVASIDLCEVTQARQALPSLNAKSLF